MNIKRQDTVLVIAGKDRNKTGKVQRVIKDENKLVIEGVNISKKHVKPSKLNPTGGIIDVTKPLDISNVLVICPHCSKAVKVSHKVTEKGKTRVCRKCGASLDQE